MFVSNIAEPYMISADLNKPWLTARAAALLIVHSFIKDALDRDEVWPPLEAANVNFSDQVAVELDAVGDIIAAMLAGNGAAGIDVIALYFAAITSPVENSGDGAAEERGDEDGEGEGMWDDEDGEDE